MKRNILVVVDRLSKYAHFLPLSHPLSAVTVAQLQFDHVFKLHGVPKTIVSDKDKVFLSQFWQEFFRLQHTALHTSLLTSLKVMAKLKLLIKVWRVI